MQIAHRLSQSMHFTITNVTTKIPTSTRFLFVVLIFPAVGANLQRISGQIYEKSDLEKSQAMNAIYGEY